MQITRPHLIEVWRGSVTDLALAARQREGVLSSGERERHGRFRFDRDRLSYLVSHVGLRLALARRIACAPEELEFSVNEFGKPRIRDEGFARRTDFNLSHSGGSVAIACTDGSPVGVDIEASSSATEPEALSKRFFSPAEARFVCEGAFPRTVFERFLRVWTAKEAFIKQRGQGLSLPLDSFSVASPGDDRSAVRMRDGSWAAGRAIFFDGGARCQGAVYSDDPNATVVFRDMRELFFDGAPGADQRNKHCQGPARP